MAALAPYRRPTLRSVISVGVMLMFAYLIYRDPTDKLIQGGMIAAFANVVGTVVDPRSKSSETEPEKPKPARSTPKGPINQPLQRYVIQPKKTRTKAKPTS